MDEAVEADEVVEADEAEEADEGGCLSRSRMSERPAGGVRAPRGCATSVTPSLR